MPDLKLATTDVADIRFGTVDVAKVMLGTFEVWPGEVIPSTPPVLFAAGAFAAASSGNSITPVMPAGIANNDVAIMPVSSNAALNFTTPSGWTVFGTALESNSDQSTKWFWKRLTGSEGNPTSTGSVGFSAALGGYGRLYVFRGCRTTGDPFEGVTMNGTPTLSTTPASAAITTTGDNRTAVCFAVVDDDNSWSSGNPPSGWSICGSRQATQVGGDAMFDAISKEIPTAATVPQVTVGTMSASDFWRTMTLALIPA